MKFIPKFKDKSILDSTADEFFVDADLILRNPQSFAQAAEQIPNFTINPITNRLPYNSSNTYQTLPYYFAKADFDTILNDSKYRLDKLVIPCVDFQIEKGGNCIIPPYFYVEDVSSQIFNVNIENITNVIKYLQKMQSNFGIYPVINISSNLLSNDNLLRYIASMYMSDEFIHQIKGFFIMAYGLDGNTSDTLELVGLLNLVKALSGKDVYVIHSNAFGYIPMLLGAKGFISGLASNESMKIENLKSEEGKQKSGWQRPSNFTYVPEIFTYISEEELEPIGYVCTCSHCNGTRPKTAADKKKHFLACRQRDIKTIFTGSFDKNLANLKKLYSDGKKKVMQMISNRQTARPNSTLLTPISKWLGILEIVPEINQQKEAEDLLAKILDDIDNNE